jgi:hypothetical protein
LSMQTNTPYIHRLGVAGLPRACRPRALQASHALPVIRTPGSASVALHCSPPVCRASLTHIAHAPISTKRAIYHDSHASSAARPTHSAPHYSYFLGQLIIICYCKFHHKTTYVQLGCKINSVFAIHVIFSISHFFFKMVTMPSSSSSISELTWSAMAVAGKGALSCSQATVVGLELDRSSRWSNRACRTGATCARTSHNGGKRSSLALAIHDNEMELVHGCHKGGARAGPCLPWRPGKSSPVAQASSYG